MALDQGTTGSRAIIFNHNGTIVSTASKEFKQIYPKPGWVEHNPTEIWSSQIEVAKTALDKAGLEAVDIAAIGITNQRETTIVWDKKSGKPVYNAIVWQCRRTAPICDQLKKKGLAEIIQKKTGLVIDAYFSGTKIKWILDNVDGVRERAEKKELLFGTVDSWLIWNLTKGKTHVTDYSNASRTMLFNIRNLDWDEEILTELDIPREMLPKALPSSHIYASTDKEIFGAEIPISGVAGDQQAALFGQACFEPGMTKNTYGTGRFLLMNVGQARPEAVEGLLTTVAWQLDPDQPPTYAYEGSIFITGAAIQWLRDGLGIISEASEIGPLAESVDSTGDVYLVPAFAGLGSPWWDPYARGTIIGITRGTGRAELARATVESMAYQVRGVVDAMSEASGLDLAELRVDGGASVMPLLLSLQADQLGVTVTRPMNQETTALGAAYLAGLAEGVWDSLDDITAAWKADAVVEPKQDRAVADA